MFVNNANSESACVCVAGGEDAGERARTRTGTRTRRSTPHRSPRTRLRMTLPADTEVDEAEIRVLVNEPGALRVFEVGNQ